jgi:CRP/FNR family transcriptional regulator, putaive post-exponential-phase nitrogen-starvation regulator
VQFCEKGYLQKIGRHYHIRQPDELHRLADVLKNGLETGG